MKRFAVYPGFVRSISDGQQHYISGGQLIKLYGLPEQDCYIVRNIPGEQVDPSLFPLFPLPRGDYGGFIQAARVEALREYARAKRLHQHHAIGTSKRRAKLRREAMRKLEAKMAWLSRPWPDLPELYRKLREKNPCLTP